MKQAFRKNKKLRSFLCCFSIFLLCFGFLFFKGCVDFSKPSEFELAYSKKHKILGKMRDLFFEQSAMKYGIIPLMDGIGCYREIQCKSLGFMLNSSYSEEELRQLAIDLTEGFLELINSNDEIKKWGKYPEYSIYNIDLSLILPKDPRFTSIGCMRGVLYFNLKEEVSPYNKKMWSESYREAFLKVYPDRESKFWGTGEEIDNTEFKKTPAGIAFCHLLVRLDQELEPLGYAIGENFSHLIGFQRNRTALRELYVTLTPFKDTIPEKWPPFTVDSARKEYFKLSNFVLNLINEDEGIRPYLANHPVTWDQLYFVIDAWNQGSKPGEVIEFFRLQNNIYYRNKHQKQLFKVESVEEAKELLKGSNEGVD
jgi:hypothetical protein